MLKQKIAIVGYAFRLPGASPGDLWGSLADGLDLVGEIPRDRWASDVFTHPAKSAEGTSYTRGAGSIGDVAGFDAAFFGISPREAEQLDPQQRLLLEMAWQSLESAGVPADSVRGQRGGVFVGFSGSDWSYRRADDLASLDATSMTGQTGSVAANRISYQLDLRGPSLAVDTACSSSLVAFHQACQSITTGESEFALAGGVALHFHPYAFVGFSRAAMLSKRGICNVFDAAGDGYVRSEGVGMFLLKPLDKALADGNRVLAVVVGSGVNCDGRTNGLTVPSRGAQADLLREVYVRAGIAPADIDYLEAHGTGTAVGDPIECHSLGAALGQARPQGSPLLIGSVKSNVGHLETASGVAGLVKAILCLQHRAVPATIHLKTPNPNIKFDEWNLKVVTETTPLDPHKRLTIGINSFGFGGANAHVVLQSPPEPQATAMVDEPGDAERPSPPLLVSGRGEAAARAAAGRLAAWIEEHPGDAPYDLAYASFHNRDWHADRVIAYGAQSADRLQALLAYAAGEASEGLAAGTALAEPSAPVFVYSGNGSQWAGMGQALLEASPVFAGAVRHVARLFGRYAELSIIDELQRDDVAERLALTEIAQPLLFAVQVGITEMLRDLGAKPAAVVGHSVGEVAAAWACGALTLEQAVQVIYERSLQQGTTQGAGGMTAVGLGEAACDELLKAHGLADLVAIAGSNSPRGVTVAGDVTHLQTLEAVLTQGDVFHRRLALDYAFHSPAMDPIETPLRHDLAGLKPGKGKLPFYSTVSGGLLAGDQLDAEYWWHNIREPVRFQGAVDALIADGYNVFVEIGPHAVLRTYINDCLRAAGTAGRVIPTLQRDDGSEARVEAAFYQMLIAGASTDLNKIFPHKGKFVDLPTYPWQRERYWHPVTSEGYNLINRYKEHPLLGYRLCENDTQWENHLDTVLYPHLADHAVGDAVVFPAAGFVEMALAAAQLWHGGVPRQVTPSDGSPPPFAPQEVEELEILAPLLLEDEPAKTVRFAIDPSDGRFTIRSRQRLSHDPWQLHVVGRLPGKPMGGTAPATLRKPHMVAPTGAGEHYALTSRVGLHYGPAFQAVAGVHADGNTVLADLAAPDAIADQLANHYLHPSLLDGCFQLLVDILRDEIQARGGVAFVPVKVGRLRVHQRGDGICHVRAQLLRRSPRAVVARFQLFDTTGALIAELDDVRFRGVLLRRTLGDHAGYLRFVAVPRPLGEARPAALPSNGSLPAACTGALHLPERILAREQYYQEVEPLLDVLCAAFAARALRQLAPGQSVIRTDTLLADGTVAPEFGPYLQRLVAMLDEDGVLEPADGGLAWSSEVELPAPDAIWTSLLGDYPDYAAEILMLGRVGENLADALQGEQAVDALLPGDPAHPMLAHYLSGSPSLRAATRALADVVVAAQAALAEGQRLRVMEFTRGHSQVAAQLLPNLDLDRCDYRITSDDADALMEVEPLLERYPAVETDVLDLNGEVPAGRFDVILLSHELATVPDPDRLVAMLCGQLAPGGALVVAEQPSSRWSEMVFGLRSGWWGERGEHTVPRQHGAAAWTRLLDRHGLGDCTVIHDLPDSQDGPYLILARASHAVVATQAESTAGEGCWLIVRDAVGEGNVLADLVAARLRDAGIRPRLASVDGGAAEGLERILADARDSHGALDGIVVLQGLPLSGRDERAAADRCVRATELVQACAALAITPQLLLVTAGATGDLVTGVPAAPVGDAALWGFGRTLMNEYPELRIRLLELADPHDPQGAANAIAEEVIRPDAEDEVIYGVTGRFAPRLRLVAPAELSPAAADNEADSPPARLDFSAPGPLKNLLWRPAPLPVVAGDKVEIAVRAAGLNFRDVMYAMGLLSDEALEAGFAGPTLGMELSGVITALGPEVTDLSVGDEVIAFAPASFAERAVTPAAAVARKPAGWSFNAAATVPTTFFTAYYALHHLAQLEEGERLLIHGAAGGVGLAAIQLGKAMGAEIFATAGSDAKRDVVRLLGADHVLDSRSLAFADDILALTDGQGVDVVLNSLAGEAINRNLRILRPFGRFLELGKRDFYENTRIGLRPFRNNISYFGIDADQLMAERPTLTRRLFRELMELFEDGTLKPLPYRAFPAAQAVDAFRYMQQSRQIGKVVLDFQEGVGKVERPAPPAGRLALRADATYLVTGGMRGFGLATARWLAGKGARHLVLLSRRGAADDEGAVVIEQLQQAGVQVRAVACDVTDQAALAGVLNAIATDMPPLRGIVHAAMVIDDGLVRSLDGERIRRVLAPKVDGARHLCALTRDLPLDFLVFYSSATTLFGNPGQSGYVAANRYLEVLAHARRAAGLPALCVSWGAIDDVGYLARNTEIKEQLQQRMGGAALSSAEALDALEQLLVRDLSGLGVMELDWGALRRFLPTALSPKFQDLAQQAEEAGVDAEGLEQLQQWLAELDDEQLAAALGEALKKEIGEILHVSPERIADDRSLYDLGMDSLMGMEMAAAVEARFGVTLPVMALSEGPTVTRLVERIVRQLRAPGEEHGDEATHAVARAAAQHEIEADAKSIAEVARAVSEQDRDRGSLTDGK